MNSLLITCHQAPEHTEYARFTVFAECLEIITFNETEDGDHFDVHSERLPYEDHPEARAVHNGRGWDIIEVMAWITSPVVRHPVVSA